jgi:hypothetical protein
MGRLSTHHELRHELTALPESALAVPALACHVARGSSRAACAPSPAGDAARCAAAVRAAYQHSYYVPEMRCPDVARGYQHHPKLPGVALIIFDRACGEHAEIRAPHLN